MIDYSQLPGQMIQTMLLIAYVRLGEPKGERGFFDWVIELMNDATDLNAAFELVREAEAQNVGFSLHNVTYENGERITYEATFYDPWGGPMCEEYTVEAPTPARAISEAWLQWHEAKQQQEQGG